MTIVHRLTDGRYRQRIEQAPAELDQSATRLSPGLVPAEVVLMGVDLPVPVSVRIRPPMHLPESEGARYAGAWTQDTEQQRLAEPFRLVSQGPARFQERVRYLRVRC